MKQPQKDNLKNAFTSILISFLLLAPLIGLHPTFCAEFERPSYHVTLDTRDENLTANDEAVVGIGAHLYEYLENAQMFGQRDGLVLRVVGTANTRKGIYYDMEWWDYLPLPEKGPEFQNTLNLGDNQGIWLSLSTLGDVAFYSGPGLQNNSLYDEVWVCSNGFLCFKDEYVNPIPPSDIPNSESLNTFIAPYWADLDPSSGTISWETFTWLTRSYFAVGWSHVRNKNTGAYVSFAVFIKQRYEFPRSQNEIIFQYYNVQWNGDAVYGMEDQEGYKGYGGRPYGTWANKAFKFKCLRQAPEIREMKIKLEKSDNNAEIYLDMNDYMLQSYNLMWERQEPPSSSPALGMFNIALKGGITLFISKVVIPMFFTGPVVGWIFGIALIGLDEAIYASNNLWSTIRNPEIIDVKEHANTTENLAYLMVPAAGSGSTEWPVDALIGANIFWIFTDNNVNPHQMTASVELKYYSYETQSNTTISTSVDITCPRDAGNTIDSPDVRVITPGKYIAFVGIGVPSPGNDDIRDFYKIWVPDGKGIDMCMKPPYGETINFDLHLYRPNKVLQASSTHGPGETECIAWVEHYEGYWFIEVNATMGLGLYNLTVSLFDAPPGGGCPTLFVWNGTDYAYETLLNIHADSDITLQHRINQSLVRDGIFYKLLLKELDEYTSHIDQVKLYVVHTNGRKDLCNLRLALHSELGNIRTTLLLDDDNRADLYPTQTIELYFAPPSINRNIAYFIFEINGYNPKDLY